MARAKVTGVDWYRWVDPDDPAQIHEAARGDTIDVTDAEMARGVEMGALEPATVAGKAAQKARGAAAKVTSSGAAPGPDAKP